MDALSSCASWLLLICKHGRRSSSRKTMWSLLAYSHSISSYLSAIQKSMQTIKCLCLIAPLILKPPLEAWKVLPRLWTKTMWCLWAFEVTLKNFSGRFAYVSLCACPSGEPESQQMLDTRRLVLLQGGLVYSVVEQVRTLLAWES